MANKTGNAKTAIFWMMLSSNEFSKYAGLTLALARYDRHRLGQVDHGRRHDAARTAVEYQVDAPLEARADFGRVVQWLCIAGQHQRRRQQRFAQFNEQS